MVGEDASCVCLREASYAHRTWGPTEAGGGGQSPATNQSVFEQRSLCVQLSTWAQVS